MTKAECIETLYGQALQAEQMVGCARAIDTVTAGQMSGAVALLIVGFIMGGIVASLAAH